MKEKDTIELECIDLDYEGMGICKKDGFVFFIEGAFPGDVILAEITRMTKNYGFGIVKRILKSSNDRVPSICDVDSKCGGCSLLGYSYDCQLAFKKKLVESTLLHVGGIEVQAEDTLHASNPLFYRNKIQMPFNSNFEYGYYETGSHHIISHKRCYLEPKVVSILYQDISKILFEIQLDSIKHVLVKINHDESEIMVVLVVREEKEISSKKEILVQKIKELHPKIVSIYANIQNKDTNVILGNKNILLFGKKTITDVLCGLTFEIGVYSFYQINHDATELCYQKAIELANINEENVVVDAYCGIGTISLCIAKKAKKVYGVEIVSEAIECAKINAKRNHLENKTEFICNASEKEIYQLVKKEKIDCVFVDPPRKGLDDSFIECILNSNIEKLVYISCNIRTLSRDVKKLCEKYNVLNVVPVDFFPNTPHVESVTLLELKKA